MVATLKEIHVTASVMGNGAFIEMARNIFMMEFLKTDHTHLFYIDSDLKFESRAFVGLVESNRPVCAGVYRRRQEPEDYPVHYIEDNDNPGIQVQDGGWVGCDRVPSGFLCIRRDVVEEMVKHVEKISIRGQSDLIPWVFHTKMVDTDLGNRTFVGEDFAWSDLYTQIFKEPIWVWPDFDFIHAGYKCNWHKFIMKQIKKAEVEGSPINIIREGTNG